MAERRDSPAIPGRRRPVWLAPTIRLRLSLLYGGLFLVTGAILLTIGYLLVRDNLLDHRPLADTLRRLGAPSDHILSRALGAPPGSPEVKLAHAVQHQLVGDALHQLLFEYLGALLAMTVVSIGAGYLLGGRALRPLREITATAQRVSGENLGERIALRGRADELRQLADTFDGMLARLDAAFVSQRRFVANASHELRTPLAIMRTELDVTMADPDASPEELRAMGEVVRDTVDRCERLIGSLLVLARSDAPVALTERVDLASLAGDCVTDFRAQAAAAQVEIDSQLDPAWAQADPDLLERLVANLIDNGIRHNVPGGRLQVTTLRRRDRVELRVVNGGPRIEPEQAEQLVQPFRRLERGHGGFGLGLSIVRSVAEAHGGSAAVVAPESGGLEVAIELPAAPAGDRTAPLSRPPAVFRDPEGSLTES